MNPLLERINAIVETPFISLESCLEHYRAVLPARVGAYHQEEDGCSREMSGSYHWVAMRRFFTPDEVWVERSVELLSPAF